MICSRVLSDWVSGKTEYAQGVALPCGDRLETSALFRGHPDLSQQCERIVLGADLSTAVVEEVAGGARSGIEGAHEVVDVGLQLLVRHIRTGFLPQSLSFVCPRTNLRAVVVQALHDSHRLQKGVAWHSE